MAFTVLEKEEICLLVSTQVVNDAGQDIIRKAQTTPSFTQPVLKTKISDEAFNNCIAKITDSQLQSAIDFDPDQIKNLAKNFQIDIEKYSKIEDLEVNKKYFFTRREISKRLKKTRNRNKFEL